ncbi:hypothetical protein P9112_012651 [Eukaryota sp. TZLM1-RC]
MILDLLKLPDGRACPHDIKILNLSHNGLTSVHSLHHFNLTHLDLSFNHITSLYNICFCTTLKKLDLSHNSLSLFNPSTDLYSLTSLNLSHNKLTSLFGLKKAPNLQYLNVSFNQLCHLHGICTLSYLQHLNITRNPSLTINDTRVLQANSALKALTVSSIDNTNLQTELAAKQSLFDYLPRVKVSFSSSHNSVDSALSLSDLQSDAEFLDTQDTDKVSPLPGLQSSTCPFLGSFTDSRVFPDKLKSPHVKARIPKGLSSRGKIGKVTVSLS